MGNELDVPRPNRARKHVDLAVHQIEGAFKDMITSPVPATGSGTYVVPSPVVGAVLDDEFCDRLELVCPSLRNHARDRHHLNNNTL